MCMMAIKPPKMPMPGGRYDPPAYGRIDPEVPQLFGHWVVTYGAMGIVLGLLCAGIMAL